MRSDRGYRQRSAMSFDDQPANCQPHPHAIGFCREERIKDTVDVFLVYALAGIFDRETIARLTAARSLVRRGLEVRDVELGSFTGNHAALQDKVNAFRDIRSVIADTLNVLCTKKKMHSYGDVSGIFHHIRQQLTKRRIMQSINVFVAFPNS